MAANHLSYLMLELVFVGVFTFGILRLFTSLVPHGSSRAKVVATIRSILTLLSKPISFKTFENHLPKYPIHNVQGFQLPLLKPATTPHMTMGLRRLDTPNWLTIDDHYLPEHHIRASFLQRDPSSVLVAHPNTDVACEEVLSFVISFLTSRYPAAFTLTGSGHRQRIVNHLTGDSFPVSKNNKPLETAARLAMEDFNILVKDDTDGDYHLLASATLFPAGWKLQERIGGTMAALHSPVPKWAKKVGCSVTRYFDHLSPSTAMERFNLFVQTSPDLFQCEALPSSVDEPSNCSRSPLPPSPEQIHIRRERQTFVPLPLATASTGKKHVLFAVHTYMTPLTELSVHEVDALLLTARSWNEDMAAYKGREGWLEAVQRYREGLGVVDK